VALQKKLRWKEKVPVTDDITGEGGAVKEY
jgi:hypothetical protein